jgi:hypothetical protein
MFVILCVCVCVCVHEAPLLYLSVKLHRTKQSVKTLLPLSSLPVHVLQWLAEQKAWRSVHQIMAFCVLTPYTIKFVTTFRWNILPPSSGRLNLVQVDAQNYRLSNGSYENLNIDTCEVQRAFLSSDWALQSGRHCASKCSNDVVRFAASSPAIKILCTCTLVIWC